MVELPNGVNSLRLLGRWMRMFTTPNQSSVIKAVLHKLEHGRDARLIPQTDRAQRARRAG